MAVSYRKKIESILKNAGKNGMSARELMQALRVKTGEKTAVEHALEQAAQEGLLIQKHGKWISCEKLGLLVGKVVKLSKTFGFVHLDSDERRIFVSGRYLMGALPHDRVLVRVRPSAGELDEGRVVKVLPGQNDTLCGYLEQQDGKWFIVPDDFSQYRLPVIQKKLKSVKAGDKVLAKLALRGQRHSEHKVMIVSTFGSSQKAASCAQAVLTFYDINPMFSESVQTQALQAAQRPITDQDLSYRIDLRDLPIFTIDSAEAKDLDDAVGIEKNDHGYRLIVSIADVSFYVKHRSALDQEAYSRGTSIYYADKVVPMLPRELSNGICSLNPNEDRLSFTVFLELDKNGELQDYTFRKSVIRSKVKGVYSEINAILDGTATQAVLDKYHMVHNEIILMHELANILTHRRRQRGAPEIETRESKIKLNTDGSVCDILPRERGVSERIIEEFMLLANQAAAMAARQAQLPFVYRVHEAPTPEKIQTLRGVLSILGYSVSTPSGKVAPKQLAEVLNAAKGSPAFSVVNMQVLRSMAKAKYAATPIGHFGLALSDYAHFTSPIRRYPDLVIHRVLNDWICGSDSHRINKKFGDFVKCAAAQSTATELQATEIERTCEDCYKAEYMAQHLQETFAGTIVSVASQGLYVELDNTIEGLVKIETLPEGEYMVVDDVELRETYSAKRYRIGDRVTVTCVKADVNSGKIDFALES